VIWVAAHFDGHTAFDRDFPATSIGAIVMTGTSNHTRINALHRSHVSILPASDSPVIKVYDLERIT
jgi:hypothetical protein